MIANAFIESIFSHFIHLFKGGFCRRISPQNHSVIFCWSVEQIQKLGVFLSPRPTRLICREQKETSRLELELDGEEVRLERLTAVLP